jgi:hypothetical protein
VIVRLRHDIATGITHATSAAFLSVLTYLGGLNNPSELTSFIFNYAESIKTGTCKKEFFRDGGIYFRDFGYTKSIQYLPSPQLKFDLTQKVVECLKTHVKFGILNTSDIFLRKITVADLRNKVIFELLDSIPVRKSILEMDFVYDFGRYLQGPTNPQEQSTKTKFVFGHSRITNRKISKSPSYSRLQYLLGMLGSLEDKVKFISKLKEGVLQAVSKGDFYDFTLALRSVNIILPEENDIYREMKNVDDIVNSLTRSLGVKRTDNTVINLLKLFIAIEDRVKNAMSTNKSA